MKTKYLFIAFIVVAIVQLSVPFKMIYDSEITEKNGTIYRFKTAPIDPIDPFRGKYVALNYELNSFTTKDTTWAAGQEIYLLLDTDKNGFAKIKSISRKNPGNDADYINTTVSGNYNGKLRFDLPFDVFYMEEGKALEAETGYAEYNRRRDAKPAYALVAVLNGNAVLKDVIVDDIPIREYVLRERSKTSAKAD